MSSATVKAEPFGCFAALTVSLCSCPEKLRPTARGWPFNLWLKDEREM
jgi:hypothetical protein